MKLRPPKPTSVIWKPHPKQAIAISCPADVVLFGGAVGGGKTDGLLGKWLEHEKRFGKWAAGLIVRRSMPELREVIRRCKRLFPRLGATWKASERTWTFPSGATILLGYLESEDDATRYWGQEFTLIMVDEAGYFPESDPIDKLASRLRSTAPVEVGMHCQLYMTANPGGSGHAWLKGKFIEGREPCRLWRDPVTTLTHCYVPSYITDNPSLATDKAYIGRIKSSGPSWFVRALLRGDWSVSVSGNIFRREWFTDNRYTVPPRAEDILAIVQSWDMASKKEKKNDRSACTTWAITERGVYLLHAFAGRMEFPELLKKAQDLYERFK